MTLDNGHWTKPQQIALVIVPALTGGLSVLGSGTIAGMIGRQKKYRRARFRLRLALCLADAINSLVFVVFPLPVPRGTPGVWGAAGNQGTCDLQGVLQHLGAVGAFCNAAISHYFLKVIRDGLSDQDFAQKYERWWYLLAVGFPVCTAMIVLGVDSFAYVSFGCWIGPEPFGCTTDSEVACTRGENGFIYGWMFMGVPLILLVCYICYCMLEIYKTVRRIAERRQELSTFGGASSSDRKTIPTSSNNNSDETTAMTAKREAAIQAYLYVGSYLVTHFWAFVVYIIDQAGAQQPFWTVGFAMLTWPLQGFLNAFVFLNPLVRSLRRRYPEMSRSKAVYNSIFHFDNFMPEQAERLRSNRRLNLALTQSFQRSRRQSSNLREETSDAPALSDDSLFISNNNATSNRDDP